MHFENKRREASFFVMSGFKISASVVIVFANLVTQIFLTRSFGAIEYGYYNYNTNIFTASISLLYFGTVEAFYSKISKRREEKELTQFYLILNIIIFVIINAILFFLMNGSIKQEIWENQQNINLIFALNSAFLLHLLSIFSNLSDAYALTKITEIGKVIQKILIFVFSLVLFLFNRLSLESFYFFQIISLLTVLSVISILFIKHNIFVLQRRNFLGLFRKYFPEFYVFCKPMFFVLIVSAGFTMAENWLIIHFSSIKEQAYYGIAMQMNLALSSIYSPLIALLIREFAIASANIIDLGKTYVKYSKIIFFVIAFLACFIAVYSDWICIFLGKETYLPAVPVIILIMVYSMGQTLGQVNGSLYLATERTREYSYISIVGIFVSLILDWLFLVPNRFFEAGLGAKGLALKMVLSQFITYNMLTFLNCRHLELKFSKMVFIQFISPFWFLVSIITVRYITEKIIGNQIYQNMYILLLLISGLLNTLLMGLYMFKFPGIFGIDKKIVNVYVSKMKIRFQTRESEVN